MKTKILALLGVALIATVAVSQVLQVRPTERMDVEAFRNDNISVDGHGFLWARHDVDTLGDTTFFADTTSAMQGMEDWIRGMVAYKCRLWDGIDWATKDSIGVRFVYQGSYDGTTWVTVDSSAAIGDTLYHSGDSLNVALLRYRFMRVLIHRDYGKPSVDPNNGQCCEIAIYPTLRTSVGRPVR